MSLKGGVSTSELFDTINDAKNGKKKAFDKLAKYAEDGTISTDAYNNLIEKYGIKKEERKKRNTKALLLGLLLLVVCLVFICKAFAHSGRTDSNGGHWDRSTGTYHYHSGKYAGQSTSSSSTFTDEESDIYADGYNEGYNEGYDDGTETGYDDGYTEGHNNGYYEGYDEGYATGNEEGYNARTKEVNAEREKEYIQLLYLALGIIAIVIIVKTFKKIRKQ